jgi:membrane protein DedA with SNARE-associated domain
VSLDQILELPFEVAIAALFVVVFCRTNAVYWVGRGLSAGYGRTRLANRWSTERLVGARRVIDRYGPFAVVLTFLTVGLQTAVNFTAGVGRMRLRYYIPATIVGSTAWALLYATAGLAVMDLIFDQAAASPWAWAVAAAVGGAVVVRLAVSRRRRKRTAEATRVDA